jgi:hypothetical protein
MVAQVSKNMTSAQKLKQQKLMGADVSDPPVAKMKVLEKSREERQRLPRIQKARRRRWLLGANLVPKRRRWLAAPKKKSVAAAPKAAPKPMSAPAASLGSIGIEQWVQSTRSVRATSSLAAMQRRAAAAACWQRSECAHRRTEIEKQLPL